MNNRKTIVTLIPIFFFFSNVYAEDLSVEDFIIKDFYSHITINEDSSVNITETIQVEYREKPIEFLEKRRMFERHIPYIIYDDNSNYNIASITVNSVVDSNGRNLPFYTGEKDNYIIIKIGKNNTYLSGKHTYIIQYKINNGIFFSDTGDSFFWDVTGFLFSNIEKISAKIEFNLPKYPTIFTTTGLVTNLENQSTTQKNCNNSNNCIICDFDGMLDKMQTYHIHIKWENGKIQKPPFLKRAWWFILKHGRNIFNIAIIIFNIAIILIVIIFYLQKKFFKKEKAYPTINIDQSSESLKTTAKKLSPIEMHALIEEQITYNAIVPTIIKMAINGFIKFKETKSKFLNQKEYVIINTFNDKSLLDNYEKFLYTAFFNANSEITLSEAAKKTTCEIDNIDDCIIDNMTKKGFFKNSSFALKQLRNKIFYVLLLGFFAIVILAPFYDTSSNFFNESLRYIKHIGYFTIVSALALYIYLNIVSFKTKEGKQILHDINIFKRTLENINIHNDIDDDFILELLPYAIALNININEWVKKTASDTISHKIGSCFFEEKYSDGFDHSQRFIELINELSSVFSKELEVRYNYWRWKHRQKKKRK